MAGGVSWVVCGGWYVACGGWCVVLADGERRMVGGCARTHQPADASWTVVDFPPGFIQSDLISSLNAAAGAVFPVAWVTPATPAMRATPAMKAVAAIAMPANFRVDDDGSRREADFPGVSGAASRSVSTSWAFWYDGITRRPAQCSRPAPVVSVDVRASSIWVRKSSTQSEGLASYPA